MSARRFGSMPGGLGRQLSRRVSYLESKAIVDLQICRRAFGLGESTIALSASMFADIARPRSSHFPLLKQTDRRLSWSCEHARTTGATWIQYKSPVCQHRACILPHALIEATDINATIRRISVSGALCRKSSSTLAVRLGGRVESGPEAQLHNWFACSNLK